MTREQFGLTLKIFSQDPFPLALLNSSYSLTPFSTAATFASCSLVICTFFLLYFCSPQQSAVLGWLHKLALTAAVVIIVNSKDAKKEAEQQQRKWGRKGMAGTVSHFSVDQRKGAGSQLNEYISHNLFVAKSCTSPSPRTTLIAFPPS